MKALIPLLALALLTACNPPQAPQSPVDPPEVSTPQTPPKPPSNAPTPPPAPVLASGLVKACVDGLYAPKLTRYRIYVRGEPLDVSLEAPCVTHPMSLPAGEVVEVVAHGGAWGLTATPSRQTVTVVAGQTVTARVRVGYP